MSDVIKNQKSSGAVSGDAEPLEREFSDALQRIAGHPVYANSKAILYADGRSAFEAMLSAIAAAKGQIRFEIYMLLDDKAGNTFVDALEAKCRAGVSVAILYDPIGCLGSGDLLQQLEEVGAHVSAHHPLNLFQKKFFRRINNRNHRKLLIVDDDVAFVGGMNVSDHVIAPPTEGGADRPGAMWKDLHLEVRGNAVAGFQKLFEQSWGRAGDRVALAATGDVSDCGDQEIVPVSAKGGNHRVSRIHLAYRHAIASSIEKVWIIQAYFVPDRVLLQQLVKAAERGVDVRIIVPGKSDSRLVDLAARSRFGKLMRGRVRIFETSEQMVHAKAAVFDNEVATVGSSNLDQRSRLHNDEINAFIMDEGFARTVQLQFLKDLEDCTEIDHAAWRKRPWFYRILEHFARPFEYLI